MNATDPNPTDPQVVPNDSGTRDYSQAFWSLAVGIPAFVSVLQLWIEAGGELQTTLLLVSNVGPVNLITTAIITMSWLASALAVAVLAIGGIVAASLPHATPANATPVNATSANATSADPTVAGARPGRHAAALVRWVRSAPFWIKVTPFALAAITWQIRYLPLLVLTGFAAFQIRIRGLRMIAGAVLAMAVYAVLVYGTVWEARTKGEWLALLLFTVPPLLCLIIAGPVHERVARFISVVGPYTVAAFGFSIGILHLATVSVLPSVVVVVQPKGKSPEYVRGHVIQVTDINTAVLKDKGGVRYIPNKDITSQELCPNAEELPRYQLWVRDFHIEDSVLSAIGRKVRPAPETGPACRISPDER